MRLPWNQWLVGASEMVGRAVVGIPVGTLVGCGLGPGVGGPAELVSYEYEPWAPEASYEYEPWPPEALYEYEPWPPEASYEYEPWPPEASYEYEPWPPEA